MKGQSRIKRGSGFKGVLSYVFNHDMPEYIGGTIPVGTVNQISSEFIALSNTRNDIKKPVWHNSLRLPKGENLSSEQWTKIATDYMSKMGFDITAQWIAVKHNKEDGEHIHIIANRIYPNGSVHLGQNEGLISTQVIAELEKSHHLTITKSVDYDANNKLIRLEKSKMTKNENEKSLRTSTTSERVRLQELIEQAVKDNPTVREFITSLNKSHVNAKPNIAKTGRMNGFSFSLNNGDLSFSGSKLGKKYTWSGLLKQGLDFAQDRDKQFLTDLQNGKISQSISKSISVNIIKDTARKNQQIAFEEQLKLEAEIALLFYKQGNQYFFLDTDNLAFTEEEDRIVCHSNTTEAIIAQTKLAKIKFGNEFKSFGSEEFRQESWMQAALQGCFDHGYEPRAEDIVELKKQLRAYHDINNTAAELHPRIAILIAGNDGSSTSNNIEISEKQFKQNQKALKSKEAELATLFEQHKATLEPALQLTDEDRHEIRKRAFKKTIPKNNREKIALAQKKLRSIKAKLEQSNSFFKKRKLNGELRSTEISLQQAKDEIDTPELITQRQDEISCLTKEAENYYSQLAIRKLMERKRIDDQVNAISSDIKILEKKNITILNKSLLNEMEDRSKLEV